MSSIMSILSFSAVALLATSTNAHMIMGSPPPYGSPDNSPLEADGSNFPCKATSNAGATVTSMTIGEPQPLWFIGSAVHGGGSCQISLTTDMPATKSSSWMVIHSIEGGCPAKNTAGNDAAGQSGGSNYTYSIPQGISPGSYTLAWTWFNKIGNREMYMNCASIKVSGGSAKRALSLNETLGMPELSERATSFPGMFKANIPTTDCETVDSQDVLFPDPGTSVEKDGSGTLTAPTGPKCNVPAGGGAVSSSGSSSGSNSTASGSNSTVPAAGSAPSGSGSSSYGSSSPSSPAMAASGAPAAAAPSVAPSVAPAAASGASGAPAAAPAAPSMAASPVAAAAPSSPAAAPSSAPSAMGNSSSSSATSSTSSTGTCSTAGQSICSPDGTQIGMCTSGLTVTWIPVASGTNKAMFVERTPWAIGEEMVAIFQTNEFTVLSFLFINWTLLSLHVQTTDLNTFQDGARRDERVLMLDGQIIKN
ncbi:hypothetical protein BDR22DRAFT_819534 [Usnea florida]